MKTIKEIVSNEWYKVTSFEFGEMESIQLKRVLNAVKEASEQAFNAGRETEVGQTKGGVIIDWKYINAQDYINQIDK